MLIQHRAEVLRVHSKRGTENTHATLVLQLAIRLDRMPAEHRGLLMGFTGEEIDVTLRGTERADPGEERPMERLWSSIGTEERMRPGPTEACSACGRVIGEDPDAAFYTPLAGPPRPVCGDCAAEPENVAELLDAQAADADEASEEAHHLGDGPMPERPADAAPITTPTRRWR
jgi:hypothetical protein